MSLYRGAGGASDATDDSTVNAVAGYASAAASSATAADASADAADASATSAAASASSAASSVSTVATHATNASNSASLAADYAAQAQLAKEAAEASEVIATERAGEASTYASQAAASASSSVHKTGDETVAGVKTFSSTIVGSVSGNAGTVTNGVYTTGDQTIAGVKTLSSNPILSAGTANGVAYLNSSKVLTSGSALTFDGTNLGVGASPTFYGGQVATAGSIAITGGNRLKLWNTGGTGVGGLSSPGTDTIAFALGASFTEQMRLTSTGLGIGTTSPSASAILDAQSTTKGVRMPNMTTTQKNAIASPAAGLMVFDTTLAKLCVYSGAAWQTITSI